MKPLYCTADKPTGLNSYGAIFAKNNSGTITQAYPTKTNVKTAFGEVPLGQPVFFDDEDQSFRDLSYGNGETFVRAIDIQARATNRIIATYPGSPLIVYAPLELHPAGDAAYWAERRTRLARCAELFDRAHANSLSWYHNEGWDRVNAMQAEAWRAIERYMDSPPLLLANVSDRNFNGDSGTWPNGSTGEVGRLITDDNLLLGMFRQAWELCDGVVMWDGSRWYDWTEGIIDETTTMQRRQRFYDLVQQARMEAA